jgi:hypothetical protein
MLLFLAVAASAVVLGYLLGGRLTGVEGLRLRWWGLVVAGLGMQFLPLPEGAEGTDLLVRSGVLAVSYSLLLLFALANLRLPGMPLIVIGLACNALVIVANGGMPVGAEALRDSGQGEEVGSLAEEGAAKHHLMTEDDVLTFLADVIAIPPPIGEAISIGDVFVYAGLIWLTVWAMRARTPSSTRTRHRGKHRRGTGRAALPVPVLPPPPERPPATTASGTAP